MPYNGGPGDEGDYYDEFGYLGFGSPDEQARYTPPAPPAAALGASAPPPPDTSGNGGGPLYGYGGPVRPQYMFDQAPMFDFQAPNEADVLKDPSYQFRLGQGQRALEQSASGKGILRTGGTLKDILGYGQNFASQEYGNVHDRAFREQSAEYQPRLFEWQTRAAAAQRAADLEFERMWELYVHNNPSADVLFNAGQD